MKINLTDPPTPEFAATHAQNAVNAVRQIEGFELDYTPASVDRVDELVLKFHSERIPPEQVGWVVFSLGCYVGEVMVRHEGGRWAMPEELDVPKDAFSDMLVSLPNQVSCNPIGKAFKRYEQGEGESLAYFYHVMTTQNK
jgi:hypothetical protein